MKKLFVTLLFAGFISFIPSSLHPFITFTLSAQIPSDGLVAWYPFNGNANDESGNGNHGVVNGATLTADRFGNAGSSYRFGIGSLNAQNIMTTFSGILGTNPRTVSVWYREIFQEANSVNLNTLLSYGAQIEGQSFELGTLNNRVGFYTNNSTVFYEPNTFGEWHCLSVAYDGVFGTTVLSARVFLDGVQLFQDYTTFNSNVILNTTLGGNLLIGGGTQLNQFEGDLDDIVIYNRVLTNTEIEQLYQDQTGQLQSTLTCNITTPTTALCAGQSATLTMNTTGGAGASSQLPANLQQGLVAYYPFNGNANDESGNGNDAINFGAVLTIGRSNISNEAFEFNLGDFMEIGNSQLLNISSDITLSVWAKFDLPQDYSHMIWHGDELGAYDPYSLSIESINFIQFRRDIADQVVLQSDISQFSGDEDFHMYSASYESLTGLWKIYIDGNLYDTLVNQFNVGYDQSNMWTIIGGVDHLGTFQGVLDEVAIYNRSLSPSEIQQLYTAQSYAWSANETTPTITVSPTQNTTYTCTVTEGNSTCTASVDITVNPNINNAVSATIIEGQSYTLGTQTLTTAGTYTEVFTSSAGCDSTVTLTLSVEPLLTCEITAPTTSLCAGQSATLTMNTNGGVGASSQLPANLQQGLVAYYPFNGNANDESGNGNNGTVNGATLAADRFGNQNCSFNFSRESIQSISYDQNDVLNNIQELTIDFWTYIRSYGAPGESGHNHFLSKSDLANDHHFIIANNFDGLYFYFDGGNNFFQTGVLPELNVWTNITVTYNYSPSGGNSWCRFYINGEEVAFFPTSQFLGVNSFPLKMGSFGTAIHDRMDGLLDDVAIYNRALSPSEIQQLYTAQSYAWSNNASTPTIIVSPTQSTTYTCTVTQGNQTCTASVDITVNPNVTNTISATIIEGETYTLGAQTLTTAGTYTEVFTSAAGCDSTVALTLAVEPALTCGIVSSASEICQGSTIQLGVNIQEQGQIVQPVIIGSYPNLQYIGELGSHLYYRSTNTLLWSQAQQYANTLGGHLVTISSFEENELVRSNLSGYTIIGATDVGQEGVWQWVDGTPWSFSSWSGGEPNNSTDGCRPQGEDFAKMYTNGNWNDDLEYYCGSPRPEFYMVEFDAPATTYNIIWSTGQTGSTTEVTPEQTLTYQVNVSSANATCTDSISITVNPLLTWYADVDGDGFGETLTTAEGCDQPAGFVADNTDCNDADATVFPNAEEICFDGMDNNCDGAVDENCVIFGCTNPEACNFNANATAEDGSCILPQPYFNCDGICINDTDGDGICDELEVSGCTDSTAFNFNPQATNDDGSCEAVLACDIATSSTTICEGNETSIVFSSSDINSGTTTLLEGTWMKRLNSSEMPVILSIGGSSYDQEGNIVYSIHKSSTTNIFSRIDLNDFSIQNQSPNGGPAELYGHVYDPVQNRILATRAGRDQVYQLNVNSPTAWALFGSGSFDSESYSCRTFYDASVGGMGFFAGYGWFSSKNWIFKNGGGSWIQARPNQNDCVVQKRREGHYSAANPTSILGAPGSNEVYFFSGAGSCTGVQNGAVCNGGSPFNDQIGTYCWLKDILKYNTVSGLFETILPPGNSAVPLEGDLVYDYERSTFYLLGGFVPPATNITNFKSITDYQNKVFKYNPAVDEEFVEIQMSGSFPDIKKLDFIGAHCGYFDALNDRIVWVRSDGIWSFDLVTTQADILWSTGETTPNITVSPTQTTTYTATVTTATQTCTDSITITVNPLLTWYADADADGFGNPDNIVQDCNQPLGYIADNTDCNDEDAATYPGADEICDNNRDENCDGVDSLCFVAILGCTDVNACNFNPEANTEDGSCVLPQPENCNGLDDNCNGQIDEGLSASAINAVSAVTALYPVCSGNSIRPANLNNGANSAVIEGNGNDLWYSFTALYNTFRAGLSAASGDNDVRLYIMTPGGCLELIETEHENTNGNQTLLSDQLTVGQTYYVAVHNISGPMNASAKICFNHLTGSSCDHYYSNSTGIYSSVCNSFKAQYRANAVAYTFDILSATQNNVNQNITPWSYTTTSASTVVARLGALLPANQGTAPVVYTLRVPVLYSLFDAAGNFENLFAQATTNCTVTLNAEPTIALRSSDRCPTNKSLTSTIAPDRTVCGAMRYDWEFTEVLPNPGTAQVVQGGNYTTVFFLSNVPGITAGKTYSVRVRPVHSTGIAGQWGSAQCLRVGAAGMVMQSESESESDCSKESRVSSISIYPNPTATGSFVLQYNGPRRGEWTFALDATTGLTSAQESMTELIMMDITGKVVFKTNVVLNGNIAEIHFGDLEAGLYLVDFGGERSRLQVVR